MKKFLIFFGLLNLFFLPVKAQPIDTSQPDVLIQTVTKQVMNRLRTDPNLKKGDINKITEFVNEDVLPYTDFSFTTQLVMGLAWRKATPEQRQQLIDQFKMLLIRTYSGALAQANPNQEIRFLPYRSSPEATDAVVRSTVMNNGQPVQLDYRLHKVSQGWLVYDLNVMGVWLIQTYQQQFRQKIQESGVDGLIQFLKQRNQQLSEQNKG